MIGEMSLRSSKAEGKTKMLKFTCADCVGVKSTEFRSGLCRLCEIQREWAEYDTAQKLQQARRDRDKYRKRWRRAQEKHLSQCAVSELNRALMLWQRKLKNNANDKAAKLNTEVSRLTIENDQLRRQVEAQAGQITELRRENNQLHAEVRRLCRIMADDGWTLQDFFRAGQTELLREQRKGIVE